VSSGSFWQFARHFMGQSKQFLLHTILHVQDSPERIAFGAALGLFVACTPTWGVQMILALALAALVRANKAATIPFVWVTNPFTIVPIYWFSYKFGALLLTGTWATDPAVKAKIILLVRESMGVNVFKYSFWSNLAGLAVDVGWPLWIGSVIMGLSSAAITYFIVRAGVIRHRERGTHRGGAEVDVGAVQLEGATAGKGPDGQSSAA